MKRFLLALALVGALVPASAQVNVVPQPGVLSNIIRSPTYAAVSVGLVPASSATDIMCIAASVSRTISLREITISGTAGTAITTPVLLYRRITVDTGGTAATSLALPVAVPLNSGDPASVAVLTAYTANPTITDSSPSLLAGPAISFAVTTSSNSPYIINAGTQVDFLTKGFDLIKGSTQQLCLNLNGVSVSSGVLAIGFKWSEN